jgi:large subunit ribosomal protein L21
MFAVIRTGGKQYVVKEGDVLRVEKLGAEAGQAVLFDQVLLIDNEDETMVGTPTLAAAVVKAEVVKNLKDDKILVFKKKRRKQFRRTRGHRQDLTEVVIVKIYPDRTAVAPEELAAKTGAAEAKIEKAVPKPKPVKKEPEPKEEKPAEKRAAKPKAKKAEKPKAEKPQPARKPKAPARKTAK